MADIEITNFVESYLNDYSERVSDVNKIDELFKGILMENGTTTDKRNVTYKKYLNDLISEVQKMLYKYKFVKHTKKNEQSNLLQIYTNSETISQVAEKFARETRMTLLGNKWTFE